MQTSRSQQKRKVPLPDKKLNPVFIIETEGKTEFRKQCNRTENLTCNRIFLKHYTQSDKNKRTSEK